MDMYRAKDSWKEPGHWTKDPPTEPGWYKTLFKRGTGGFIRVQVVNGTLCWWDQHWRDFSHYRINDITHWWSQPEVLPPLPEGE